VTGQATTSTEPDAGGGHSTLDERYGRTTQKRRRDLVIIWTAAAAFAIVLAAWVVWVAFDDTDDTVASRDIAHRVLDDRTVRISYDVSMEPGLTAQCALQVQSENHSIVGWKIVDIPASDSYTQAFTDTVRTTQLGVTGLIYRCWLS
jgi:hypothetical protein